MQGQRACVCVSRGDVSGKVVRSCGGIAVGTTLRVQTNRNHVGGGEVVSMSEHAKRTGVGVGDDAAAAAAEAAVWGSTTYSASTDAGDAEVNFHRPEMFCEAALQ